MKSTISLSQFLESYAQHVETGFGALNQQTREFAATLRGWAELVVGLDLTSSDMAHEGTVNPMWVKFNSDEAADLISHQAQRIRALRSDRLTLDRKAQAKGYVNAEHALKLVAPLNIRPEPATEFDYIRRPDK